MSTRSFIAKLNENGSVSGNYCHHDGYPDGVGKMLKENYADPDKIDALLALGSLSSLGPGIHDGTIAYSRDRKEALEPLTVYTTVSEMMSEVWNELGAEFAYVFDGTKWQICDLFNKGILKQF